MKTYKQIIRETLMERKFEITETGDESELTWWIEDQWTITRSYDELQLLVLFLTDLGWENGPKEVSEIIIVDQPMTGYTDTSHKIAGLSLHKGRFDKKTNVLSAELDAYLHKALP